MDAEKLERMQEILRGQARDEVSARARLEALRPLVDELLESYEREAGRDGGEWGRLLLSIIEKRLLRDLNGRAELSDNVSLVSCSAHVGSGAVVVDLRLKVGTL